MKPKVARNISFLSRDFRQFSGELAIFTLKTLHLQFVKFESGKSIFVTALYKQRGKLANKLMHSGMAGLTAFGAIIAPVVAQEFPGLQGNGVDPWDIQSPSSVLSASTQDPEIATSISTKDYRDKIIEYTVAEGDTVSTIAEKFNISTDTIRWENDLKSKDAIKVGQALKILPVTGVSHKVSKGDTVNSIADKYDTDAQQIVSFPFNTFEDDETFRLSVGQVLIVPDGIIKDVPQWQPVARVRQVTPDAGTVVASGSFVWPTAGKITQNFSWYHKALDIANKSAPGVLAADSGKVVAAGWSSVGYGNHVVIDHGNGYRTLYAHMSRLYVVVGQSVGRGAALGQMGSTGRSTGTHLHFEVIHNGVYLNPWSVLR